MIAGWCGGLGEGHRPQTYQPSTCTIHHHDVNEEEEGNFKTSLLPFWGSPENLSCLKFMSSSQFLTVPGDIQNGAKIQSHPSRIALENSV